MSASLLLQPRPKKPVHEFAPIAMERLCWRCDAPATIQCETHGTPLCGHVRCIAQHRWLYGMCSAQPTHGDLRPSLDWVGYVLWAGVAFCAAVGCAVFYVLTT